MLIRWVNHASFIVETERARLICDPWLEGTAFNDGWRLLSPTKFSYNDFRDITHIWFSHEHPDHFAPPNLRKIPDEYRRQITVLFHWTKDKRVIKLCKDFGFQTQEMPDGERVSVEDMELICGRNEAIDSWVGIEAGGQKLLNMNDCVYKTKRELDGVQKLVCSPDVLLTQFSYANWAGNRDDVHEHCRAAANKRNEIRRQAEVLRPKWVIPFASFVWFSHQENYYLNEGMNRVGDIAEYLAKEFHVEPVVLYPGDTWEVGAPHDSTAALQQYEEDYAKVFANPQLDKPKMVSDEDLRGASAKFLAQLKAKNNRLFVTLLPAARAYLTDKDQTAVIDANGLKLLAGRVGSPDIEMSSDSLLYCFRFGWGSDSLQVNGRYQVPEGANQRRFFRIFRVACLNSGEEFLDAKFVAKKIADRTARWLAKATPEQQQQPS
jgi:UDP-MurNAc hydroxylase